MSRHILWINEIAASLGGCESYVRNTAMALRGRGLRCTLLYNPLQAPEQAFLANFDAAFPIVELRAQVQDIGAKLCYVHRLSRPQLRALHGVAIPVLRFFHDHRLFCLREHKYRTLSQATCTQPLGPGCWSCLGMLKRSASWPGVGLSSLSALRAELEENKGLDGFVVASRYMAEHVALHGFSPERIHTIPLYAPTPPEATEVPREQGLIVFVGQLIRGKGVDVLLDAMTRLDATARLHIVGSGAQEQALREQVERLGLGQRVRFLGPLYGDEKYRELRRAWVLAAPSRSPETFGLMGVEAMSCATPVVATQVGGMGEWLEDGVTGLSVPPNDAPALAEALRSLLTQTERARQMGEAAKRRYHERFRIEQHLDALQAVFDQALSRPQHAHRRPA
ncbi:MAG: glycosyltransferase family 4 protein [Myxococcota bacterium]|jgi:glycosyltransferase involved in cell wall biosynthesis|nr:glycosyltransferase family 4 protein [Myxococcota bacterium]